MTLKTVIEPDSDKLKSWLVCMNVTITYADLSKPFAEYEKYLPLVSSKRRERISRFNFEKDKIISLVTELLIRYEISQQLGIPFSEIDFGYGEHGKPYILNDRDYCFSVSHSDNCIAFAGGMFPIGIDVERVSRRNMKIAKRFFTADECKAIEKSKEPEETFYKIWTSKEAYVKMLGAGLSKSFRSFDIADKSLNCRFATKRLPEFMLTVCAEKISGDEIIINEINA